MLGWIVSSATLDMAAKDPSYYSPASPSSGITEPGFQPLDQIGLSREDNNQLFRDSYGLNKLYCKLQSGRDPVTAIESSLYQDEKENIAYAHQEERNSEKLSLNENHVEEDSMYAEEVFFNQGIANEGLCRIPLNPSNQEVNQKDSTRINEDQNLSLKKRDTMYADDSSKIKSDLFQNSTNLIGKDENETASVGQGSGQVSTYFSQLCIRPNLKKVETDYLLDWDNKIPESKSENTKSKVSASESKTAIDSSFENTRGLCDKFNSLKINNHSKRFEKYNNYRDHQRSKLLSSILKNDTVKFSIKNTVKLVSQTIVHVSMIFNLLLMTLCNDLGSNDSLDNLWSCILFGDAVYVTCIKFLIIPQYYQNIEFDYVNSHYLDYINSIIHQYFGDKVFTLLPKVKEKDRKAFEYYYLNILTQNIVPNYRKRFLNTLCNTYWKRQRECIRCFVEIRFPLENKDKLIDYIQNRINGVKVFSKFDKDLNIAKFIHEHQNYIYGVDYNEMKRKPFKIVRYFYFLSKYIGALRFKGEFALAPISKISHKFIDVNDEMLANMFGYPESQQHLSLGRVFRGTPRNCKKIITDGDVCFFDNQKRRMSLRHRPNKHRELDRLYHYLTLRNVDFDKWRMFIYRYLEICNNVWENL